jgi:branched-chain amino acid aminotransferase
VRTIHDNLTVYVDGDFVSAAEASVSAYDHAVLYGGAIFEGIRVYDDTVFRLSEHLDRLYDSAKIVKLDVPLDRTEMRDAITSVLEANPDSVDYVRPIVSRGTGPLGLGNMQRTDPTVLILVSADSPRMERDDPLTATTVPTRRTAFDAIEGRIKATNYLNNMLAQLDVFEADTDCGIMLDRDGYVAEAPTHNVFCVNDGVVQTPTTEHVLDGITRQAVLDIADNHGIPNTESKLTRYDLTTADELFITNTMSEIGWIRELDGHQVGDGELGDITDTLVDGFREIVHEDGYTWR